MEKKQIFSDFSILIKKIEDIKKMIVFQNIQIMVASDNMYVASTNMLYLHVILAQTSFNSKNPEKLLSGLHVQSL